MDEIFEINSNRIKTIKLFSLTWNMHGLEPTESQIKQLLDPHKNFDLYCIGSEECLRSIFKSFFVSDKSLWEKKLQDYFGNKYQIICSKTLCAIHLVIFIKTELMMYLSDVKTDMVKTGGGNLLGNKGAVGISFNLNDIGFMIINCHLAALHGRSDKRNEDFNRCIMNMIDNNKKKKIDFLLFMGDLNYRLNNLHLNADELKKNYLNYLQYDQLTNEKNSRRLNTLGFQEGKINFMPSFKYWNNTNDFQYFDTLDIDQAPAWTDRIFYKKGENDKSVIDVIQEKYDSMQNVLMSDHKPVYSYFTLSFLQGRNK